MATGPLDDFNLVEMACLSIVSSLNCQFVELSACLIVSFQMSEHTDGKQSIVPND